MSQEQAPPPPPNESGDPYLDLLQRNVSSNNEAEYGALYEGLLLCATNGIKLLNVYGDSMLIIKQIQGIWSYKSDKLRDKLREVKGVMKKFAKVQVHYIAREKNILLKYKLRDI
ncbi:hypothetical protein L7F22_062106 [Adiantum nelumboides]|nr:hypothetical protein [Adiantum nelumboides]